MSFFVAISNWFTPAKLKLLEAGVWAAGVGLLAGTLRIIAARMPMRAAVTTLATSVLLASLVGLAVENIVAVEPFKNAIIAISAIAAKEWLEMTIRTVGRLRDKSDKIADGAIEKVVGRKEDDPPKQETEEVKP